MENSSILSASSSRIRESSSIIREGPPVLIQSSPIISENLPSSMPIRENPRSAKRKRWTIARKHEIISEVERNPSVSISEMSKWLDIAQPTLSVIMRQKDKIREQMRTLGDAADIRRNVKATPSVHLMDSQSAINLYADRCQSAFNFQNFAASQSAGGEKSRVEMKKEPGESSPSFGNVVESFNTIRSYVLSVHVDKEAHVLERLNSLEEDLMRLHHCSAKRKHPVSHNSAAENLTFCKNEAKHFTGS